MKLNRRIPPPVLVLPRTAYAGLLLSYGRRRNVCVCFCNKSFRAHSEVHTCPPPTRRVPYCRGRQDEAESIVAAAFMNGFSGDWTGFFLLVFSAQALFARI